MIKLKIRSKLTSKKHSKIKRMFVSHLLRNDDFLISDFLITLKKRYRNLDLISDVVYDFEVSGVVKIDFYFCDFSVSYDGCLKDLNLYMDLVKVYENVEILKRYEERLKINYSLGDFFLENKAYL